MPHVMGAACAAVARMARGCCITGFCIYSSCSFLQKFYILFNIFYSFVGGQAALSGVSGSFSALGASRRRVVGARAAIWHHYMCPDPSPLRRGVGDGAVMVLSAKVLWQKLQKVHFYMK